ncbi:MAG: histidinol-phosphate transaminase [Dehalococcoidia bacterium]|jgi:histidinol-phosphate aminotransferase
MSGEGITKFIRSDLAGFGGYVPSKALKLLAERVKMPINGISKLDANENLHGCSPKVNEILGKFPYLNIYPDAGQTEIRQLLADYTKTTPERIVVSNGSDELIGLILRLFLEPGDEVINMVPTFDMFRFGTILCQGKLVEVPRDEEYRVDVAAVKKAITKRTKLIILANPNNPTGTPTPREDMVELIETGVPIVADEAYVEFSGETVTPLVEKYDNLIVLRTFSKWAGLAGLRVGYGIMHPKLVGFLQTIKQPYNVNIAARVAVRESLKDVDYLMKNVRAIVAERERLYQELAKISWLKPFPSQANFIFCHVLNGKAAQIQKELEDRGILIRYFDIPLLQNSLRISVGLPRHTDAVIKALKEIGGD